MKRRLLSDLLIDEYENLLDFQQQVFNTLIKHAAQSYTFKIGVRELGWRCRTTLNTNEQLIHPADYAKISLTEKLGGDTFRTFARDVCQRRFAKLAEISKDTYIPDVREVLPGLSEEDESVRLGVMDATASILSKLDNITDAETQVLARMSPLEVYFLEFWSRSNNTSLHDVLKAAAGDPAKWRERYDNYKYVLLFTIRKGKRGVRKLYCGWNVFTQLADGNIRYLLELVVQSLMEHIHADHRLGEPVDPMLATRAAQLVGGKYVSDLEGLSIHGAPLTKLLLALGRIFGRMAAEAEGHTPELNQFRLADSDDPDADAELVKRVDELLNAAVMHLALVRFPGNKLTEMGDTKDYTYMMHPIFAPFFEFSHRKKRHMVLTRAQVLDLVLKPKHTIRAILLSQNRHAEDLLPEQLQLFESFYHGGT